MFNPKRLVPTILALLLVAAAWWPVSEASLVEHSEAGLKRALVTFAVARGLNAIISVAQGTEVALQPAGLGAVVAIGQILDPINDLVEQFSTLMLFASVAFGLQIFLIKIGAHALVSLLLSAAALGWLAMAWRRGGSPPWLSRLLLVLVIVRFAMPLCTLASDAVYQAFMADRYAEAQVGIEQSEKTLRSADSQLREEPVPTDKPADGKKSWLDRAYDKLRVPDILMIPDIKQIADDIQRAADRSVNNMIDLIVMFLLQTIVLPLLFLWLLIVACRSIFAPAGPPDARAGSTTA